MVVFQDDVNMINGFTDVNGVKHSYIFFVDKDESGNLVPEKITVMLWHE